MSKTSSKAHSTGRIASASIMLFIVVWGVLALVIPSSATPNVPYELYNRWTHLDKPGIPVSISFGEVPPGSDWTYESYLFKDSKYHIYCIGEWCNLTDPDTDYDILVYDEGGSLVSTHTQSAGLPEQVSNDERKRYFVPPATGQYSFRIMNDALESQNSKNATFMIIQHIETNTEYTRLMAGRDSNNNPQRYTNWAYEFNVSADAFEVYVDVPPTLDMYEVRIYPMANEDKEIGETIHGVLVPSEPLLYGELMDGFGGFNISCEGYRASDSFASCEYLGQDMMLRHDNVNNTLYHLVLIAEHGSGTVGFYVKTDFEPPDLRLKDPQTQGYILEQTPITVSMDDESPIKSFYIKYTDDGSETWRFMNMTHVSGDIYSATLPSFSLGKQVAYTVVAIDEVDNRKEVEWGFSVVKDRPDETTITCTLDKQRIKQNGALHVTGYVTPKVGGIPVKIRFVSSTASHTEMAETASDGVFSCSFNPSEAGKWSVLAEVEGGTSFAFSQSALQELEVTSLTPIDRVLGIFLGFPTMMREPPLLYVLYGVVSLGATIVVYKVGMRIRNRKYLQKDAIKTDKVK